MSDPYDPINAAMRHLHQQNLIAAKDAEIKKLQEADHTEFWSQACKAAEARAANQTEHIQAMRYAGNELARVLDDIAQITELDAIAKAVVIATIAKWNRAKTGQS
jgi:hypothetical protein